VRTIICKACNKEFEYNVKEYGGYNIALGGNLCKVCNPEAIEIQNRHHQEIKNWLNSKNIKK
jgi:translation initiation factor 1 (eIF-1/SUI1)